MGKKTLSREDFFRIKPQLKEIDVPGYGAVMVRSLAAGERERFIELGKVAEKAKEEKSSEHAKCAKNALIFVWSCCVTDGEGEPIFRETDVEKILSVPAPVFDFITDQCMRASGVAPDSIEDAKKNLGPTAKKDSGTG